MKFIKVTGFNTGKEIQLNPKAVVGVFPDTKYWWNKIVETGATTINCEKGNNYLVRESVEEVMRLLEGGE